MKFVPLHIRSSYSFLKSGILLNKLFEKAIAFKYETLGLCDLEALYGVPEFSKLGKKNNIKTIVGEDIHLDEYLLSLFAKNEDGYKNLCRITSRINFLKTKNLQIDKEYIETNSKGLICVLSTHGNPVFSDINDSLFEKISYFNGVFEDFYIGIETYTLADKSHSNLIKDFALKYNLKTIAFPYCSYLDKDNAIVINILDAIRDNSTIERDLIEIKDPYFYFKNIDEILSMYDEKDILETQKLADLVSFDFDLPRGNLIHYLEKSDKETEDYFVSLIKDGAVKKGIDLSNKVYRNRLNSEFKTIKTLGYINYFLVVQDYINFAKNNNIPVGPGRGSAAGSLIAYCLGITDVNPIKYNLLFERFLNIKRKTMPDIDIDISDIRRDEVINYLIEKYGYQKVARVSAFQTIAAKQAIRDIGRVYRVERTIIDELSKTIPNNFKDEEMKNFSLDYAYEKIPAFKNKVDSDEYFRFIFDEAHRIEGLPRQRGLHAAGVVLNNAVLEDCIPLDYENSLEQVVEYEKDYLEDQGFLKMDLLGLSNLTVIDRCLKNIEKTYKKTIKMEEIPYDTPEIFKLILENKTMGLFQLDTSAANKALIQIKPRNFLEVVATISLDRPGPMQFIPSYSRRKEGLEKVTYLSKDLEPILKETFGIIVYQEQIMQIAIHFAGFDFADADIFRRAISKKHLSEIVEMKEKFINGAVKKGHNRQISAQIFDQIQKFANYGFNKSHAVSYAMIACKEAYLKANYPIEFYCAILDQQYGSNDVKFSKYLDEIKKSHIKVLLPNINESTLVFESYDNGLLLPLSGISNFPIRTVINILNDRKEHGKFESFINFVTRMMSTSDKITESQLSKLIDAGVFDSLENNRKALKMSIPNAIQYAASVLFNEGKLINDFGITFSIPDVEDDPLERLENELVSLGVMLSDSPLNYLPEDFDKSRVVPLNEIKASRVQEVVGVVRSIKQIIVKKGEDKGKPMAFVTIFDNDSELDLTFFSDKWKEFSSSIAANQILYAKGRVDSRNTGLSLIVNEAKILKG